MKNIIYSFILALSIQSLCVSQNNLNEPAVSNAYLTTLIDSIVGANLSKHTVPGAGYAIVKNGEIIHIGSQGFANIDDKEKVRPQTQFMLGSISKLFTTIAVLQLYEANKVALDADINSYLESFQIPYKVTLRQLLTHTAGLEESVMDRNKLSAEETSTLEVYLEAHLPEQILEPGKYPAYSNHGIALAGLVVQEVSKVRFEDYVNKYILDPLGMQNSVFELILDDTDNLATSYKLKGKKLTATPYEYVEIGPAAMLISTAEDMAKFMMFQLNPSESKILKPATLKLMQKQQFAVHQKQWGRSFGFFERQYRGIDMLEHGGNRNGFYSQLTIAPMDSLGIFVICNGGASAFRTDVTFDFLRKLYPQKSYEKKFLQDNTSVSEYEGTYRSNRRVESDFSKLIIQVISVDKIKVESLDSKTLSLFGYDYQLESTDQLNISNDSLANFPIVFGRNGSGEVDTLFLPGRSDSLKKMKWYEYEEIAYVIFGICFIIFIGITINTLIKFKRKKFKFHLKKGPQRLSTYKFLYSTLCVLFVIILTTALLVAGESLQYRIPKFFYIVFGLSTLSIPLLLIVAVLLIGQWKQLSRKSKMYDGLLLILAICFSWQLYYWNLIGFNF